jgi:hypothetical protein
LQDTGDTTVAGSLSAAVRGRERGCGGVAAIQIEDVGPTTAKENQLARIPAAICAWRPLPPRYHGNEGKSCDCASSDLRSGLSDPRGGRQLGRNNPMARHGRGEQFSPSEIATVHVVNRVVRGSGGSIGARDTRPDGGCSRRGRWRLMRARCGLLGDVAMRGWPRLQAGPAELPLEVSAIAGSGAWLGYL